jgi:dTMP kinase
MIKIIYPNFKTYMRKNLFIAIEGLDGSGKSTQVKPLAENLKALDRNVYTTAEPTQSRIGLMIKDIFKHKMVADHTTIAALYAADRLEHVLNKTDGLLKKLEEGYTVITDRYYFSSFAYHGTHMDMDWVIELNSMVAGLLRPDLNIFIDVPIDVCVKRLNKGRSLTELYEDEANLNQVRKKYFEAFEKLEKSEKIFIADGNRPAEMISKDIWQEVSKMLTMETKVQ